MLSVHVHVFMSELAAVSSVHVCAFVLQLDADQSPLALLAKICRNIGKDSHSSVPTIPRLYREDRGRSASSRRCSSSQCDEGDPLSGQQSKSCAHSKGLRCQRDASDPPCKCRPVFPGEETIKDDQTTSLIGENVSHDTAVDCSSTSGSCLVSSSSPPQDSSISALSHRDTAALRTARTATTDSDSAGTVTHMVTSQCSSASRSPQVGSCLTSPAVFSRGQSSRAFVRRSCASLASSHLWADAAYPCLPVVGPSAQNCFHSALAARCQLASLSKATATAQSLASAAVLHVGNSPLSAYVPCSATGLETAHHNPHCNCIHCRLPRQAWLYPQRVSSTSRYARLLAREASAGSRGPILAELQGESDLPHFRCPALVLGNRFGAGSAMLSSLHAPLAIRGDIAGVRSKDPHRVHRGNRLSNSVEHLTASMPSPRLPFHPTCTSDAFEQKRSAAAAAAEAVAAAAAMAGGCHRQHLESSLILAAPQGVPRRGPTSAVGRKGLGRYHPYRPAVGMAAASDAAFYA